MSVEKEAFLATEPDSPALTPALSPALRALWWEAQGDWDKAHELVQPDTDACAWVHAYLHRVEGDLSNAAYWYRRAKQPVFEGELQAEWLALLQALHPDATQA